MENKDENKQLSPIIIQGAMDIEIEYLIKKLDEMNKISIGNFDFFKGYMDSYPVIISKTEVGVVNCTIATMIAIMKFHPIAIINQGIAGAHVDYIHHKDIVVGQQCININAFSMPIKEAGEGSNPFEWEYNGRAETTYFSDERLSEAAKNIAYDEGKLYFGVLGSGDVFNRELDRINWIHQEKNTLCEEMESIGAYTTSKNFNIPCIGVRVISNNEITKEEYDKSTAIFSQKFVLELIKEYIKKL